MSMIVHALCLALASAAVPADLVTALPGYDGALPSKHYSGYMRVGNMSGTPGQLHYWLVESENDPASDPIVLWLNGGPGSSSLIGLLTENGPIMTNDDSLANNTGTPKIFRNPNSWSTVATMLYLESPKGVGFSYCDTTPCHNDDMSTSQDAHEFLVNFFKAYPEYANSDFYITGESYAGVYIPMLIDQIDKGGVVTNFKGAAIGNGCWGSACFYGVDENEIDFHVFAGHSMISQTLEQNIDEACGSPFKKPLSAACHVALAQMTLQAGNYYVYNIYDVCGNDQLETPSQLRARYQDGLAQGTKVDSMADSLMSHPQLGEALNDYKCGASKAMDKWLADPAVISALHVKAGTRGMTYSSNAGDLRALYDTLFAKHRIVIYSGDADGCVPYWGSAKWTREMGYTVTKDWSPWLSNSLANQGLVTAGYVIKYDKMTFVTVRGAGHMVPQFKPVFAHTMFTKFLADSF